MIRKHNLALFLSLIIMCFSIIPSYAAVNKHQHYPVHGDWDCSDGNWRFSYDNHICNKEWVYAIWNNHPDWYYFDDNGIMENGWVKLEDRWYYFSEEHDGSFGAWIPDPADPALDPYLPDGEVLNDLK